MVYVYMCSFGKGLSVKSWPRIENKHLVHHEHFLKTVVT